MLCSGIHECLVADRYLRRYSSMLTFDIRVGNNYCDVQMSDRMNTNFCACEGC